MSKRKKNTREDGREREQKICVFFLFFKYIYTARTDKKSDNKETR